MNRTYAYTEGTPDDTIEVIDECMVSMDDSKFQIDIQASNAAGIESVACFWGSKEKAELLRSEYSHAIINPSEILTLIR